MIKLPIPDIAKNDIYALKPEIFINSGVRLVFLDVDNTLIPYSTSKAPPELTDWVKSMQEAGLELFILSNNRGERPGILAGQLGLEFVKRAKKPSTAELLRISAEKKIPPENCALVGDQVYTDIACAKRAGALAVLVKPIKFSNPFFILRYIAELPFRWMYREGRRNK